MIKEKEKDSSNESKSKRVKRVKIIRSDDVCVWDRVLKILKILRKFQEKVGNKEKLG